MASIQFSWISTAKARTKRKQLSPLGKMRTTNVKDNSRPGSLLLGWDEQQFGITIHR
jgi:hypothetical protein